MRKNVDVWYLAHSGFAVSINDFLLIFDYYLDNCDGGKPCLGSGVICPEEIIHKSRIFVFSSHRHHDHFNPVILSWKEKLPQAQFFLSSDIPGKYHREWTHMLKPNQTFENEQLKIQAFKSTDEGVAFLVTVEGIAIYHAGDLNWWHWHEESKQWNNNMEARFKKEVSLIQDYSIDIAFLTADPRQETAELWGIAWFLEHVNVKVAFPMHFWDDYSIMERIQSAAEQNPIMGKIKTINARGQHFTLDI